MSQMQAAAVITARDLASPVFARVAASAQAAANRYAGVAGRLDAVQGALKASASAFALPAAAAMGALISRTQEFEKALVGVQIAGIADNLKDGVVNFEAIRAQAENTREEALRLSRALSLNPTGFVKAGEAALKMGLSADKVSKLMEMSGSVHLQDRQISQEKATEFLGTAGILFGAGADGRDYNADITKYANQWLGVANMTRTSASRLEEGLRQFAPLYASLGESFLDTAALVGAMTQAGQLDTEAGTALKSMGVRMLNMTHTGRDAALVSGLWRNIQEQGLIDMTGTTARQAMLNLKQVLPGQIDRKSEPALRKLLEEGEKNKAFTDAGYQNRLFAMLNKITGAKDAPTREAVQEKTLGALLTGGGKIQMTKILQLMAKMYEKGELTDAQLAKIGEGRHLSRYKALFKMLPEFEKLQKSLSGINSEFTDAGNKLWNESNAGKWEGTVAAMDRAFVRLRDTAGVRSFVEMLEQAATKFAELPKGVQEFGGKALAASVGVGALGMALGGISKAATVLAASPIIRALLIGGGIASVIGRDIFMGPRPQVGDMPGEGMTELFGEGAPIWETLERLKLLGSELGDAFSDISGSTGELAKEFAELFGIDPEGSVLLTGLKKINSLITSATGAVKLMRDWWKGGSFPNDLSPYLPPDAQDFYRQYRNRKEPIPVAPPPPINAPDSLRQFGSTGGPQRHVVEGQADVKVQSEITVKVDGPGQVTDQRGGSGSVSMPLNPGRTMTDTGSGGAAP